MGSVRRDADDKKPPLEWKYATDQQRLLRFCREVFPAGITVRQAKRRIGKPHDETRRTLGRLQTFGWIHQDRIDGRWYANTPPGGVLKENQADWVKEADTI